MREPSNAPEPVSKPTRPRRDRGLVALGGVGAIALLLCLTGLAAAAPTTPATEPSRLATAAVSPLAVSGQSWAWGAAANLSVRYDFVGAYNNSSSLGGGNLTQNGAYVALQESVSVGYAAYVVVQAQATSNASLFVTIRAAEYSAEQIGIAASGTFPAAGTYNASSSVPLVPMNFSLAAYAASLTAAAGYLNYTVGPNGTLALANEHLEVLKAFAFNLTATDFPNSTRDSNGDTVLKYVSGSMAAEGWAGVNFSASFSPALLLVQGPVQVGASWLASSTASVNGTTAYSVDYAASIPGGPTARWSQAGASQLSTVASVQLNCAVIGTETVHLPDGSTENDYVVEYTVAPGSSNWTVADGLFVLPGGNGTSTSVVAAAVPEQPVHAAAASAPPSASPSARALYSPARGMPDSGRSNPAGVGPVTASPMTPAQANAAMNHLSAPHVPLGTPAGFGPVLVLGALIAAAVTLAGIAVWHRRQMRRIG